MHALFPAPKTPELLYRMKMVIFSVCWWMFEVATCETMRSGSAEARMSAKLTDVLSRKSNQSRFSDREAKTETKQKVSNGHQPTIRNIERRKLGLRWNEVNAKWKLGDFCALRSEFCCLFSTPFAFVAFCDAGFFGSIFGPYNNCGLVSFLSYRLVVQFSKNGFCVVYVPPLHHNVVVNGDGASDLFQNLILNSLVIVSVRASWIQILVHLMRKRFVPKTAEQRMKWGAEITVEESFSVWCVSEHSASRATRRYSIEIIKLAASCFHLMVARLTAASLCEPMTLASISFVRWTRAPAKAQPKIMIINPLFYRSETNISARGLSVARNGKLWRSRENERKCELHSSPAPALPTIVNHKREFSLRPQTRNEIKPAERKSFSLLIPFPCKCRSKWNSFGSFHSSFHISIE